MLENRIIVTAILGYIIGIIMGLYCKISIVLFYLLFYLIYLIYNKENKKTKFKLFSIKRYFRYIKIIFNKKVIKVIIIFSIISNTIVLVQNYKYENLYSKLDKSNCEFIGIVVSNEKDKYKVKITNEKYANTYIYIYLKENINIEYGDEIIFKGIFSSPKKRSNYKGFDYKNYLKTKKIYGTVKVENLKVIAKNKGNFIIKNTNKLYIKIKEKIENAKFSNDEKSILKGILLGDTKDISKQILNNFSESNISHILAVSGMHISYIILFSNFVFNKLIGKHYSKIITSIVIIIYMCIVNFTPSVVRAGISGIILVLSNFFYRKNDVWESLALALFVILIYNPFLIENIGLKLSFAGTIGIISFYKNFKNYITDFLYRKNRKAIRKNKKVVKIIIKVINSKVGEIILDVSIVTISATLAIMPILWITFKKVSITSLIVSVLTSFIIGPIMILGLIFIIINVNIIEKILAIFLKILIGCARWGSNLPLNQIYLITPSILFIITYYILIFSINFIINIYLQKNPTVFQKRIKNLISFVKYKIKSNKRKFISIILIIIFLYTFISIIPKNLKIHFIDVGQGDSSLIITPRNNSILIDGGGSDWSDFNVRRKNTNAIFIIKKNSSN